MKRVLLLGQPNCGKSSFFSQISGVRVQTSNFPGTTVKVSRAKVVFGGETYEVVDLPGTYSLFPSDEAEEVTLKFLLNEPYDIIVNIMDASLIWRSLEFTLELAELKKPMVLLLNMMDEAQRKKIKIDVKKLSEILGIPVIPMVAVHGKGIYEAVKSLSKARVPAHFPFTKHVEEKVKRIEKEAGSRFLAVKYLEGALPPPPHLAARVKEIQEELVSLHGIPPFEIFAAERHHLSMKIAEKITSQGKIALVPGEKVDRLLLHPFFGYLMLLLIFASFFALVFWVGSVIENLTVAPLESLTQKLVGLFPSPFTKEIISSLMDGITGGVGIVLPYMIPLIFFLSFLEEAGYLSRVAFLTDVLMHKIGLHGKAIVPFLLGYGCTVPALMGTRIIEDERDRIISALLIPFIPCSARTTVILALVGYFMGFWYALAFYFANIIIVGLVGSLISRFKKEPSAELIIEVPSYKLPSLQILFKKLAFQVEEFIFYAWPVLIAGSVILGFIHALNWDIWISSILSPLMKALSLPSGLGITLIFGFLRKELTLIMASQALGVEITKLGSILSAKQMLVFTTFVTFYIPCLSSISVQIKEFGWKTTLYSIALSLSVAFLFSFLVRIMPF